MPKPCLIQIGNRILNVNAIRHIDIEGRILNVYVSEEERPLQFMEAEGDALLAVLETGYLVKLNLPATATA